MLELKIENIDEKILYCFYLKDHNIQERWVIYANYGEIKNVHK
jgi:hypothetical protein